MACIIKPVKFQSCHKCGNVGHKASSPDYPGIASEKVRQMIQPFRGGQCELSNLHVYLEGCAWQVDGHVFESSEKEFQYRKLIHHQQDNDAKALLDKESTIEIMQDAKKSVPEVDAAW